MPSESITVKTQPWKDGVQRLLATTKREAPAVLKSELKGVLQIVVDITPPGSQGVRGIAARQQGEAAVEKGIRGIYGTPNEAMELMKGGSSPDDGMAKGFWRHQKRGETEDAAILFRAVTGRGFAPFDGGKLHQQQRAGRARPRNRGVMYYVSDPKELDAYVKLIKSRVFWDAAGWKKAAAAVGLNLPQMISKHDAPGSFDLQITDAIIKAIATNAVKYASNAADMDRRIQWALDTRRAIMDRRWNEYMATLARRAGFVVR
jgi:hypothetical protein